MYFERKSSCHWSILAIFSCFSLHLYIKNSFFIVCMIYHTSNLCYCIMNLLNCQLKLKLRSTCNFSYFTSTLVYLSINRSICQYAVPLINITLKYYVIKILTLLDPTYSICNQTLLLQRRH